MVADAIQHKHPYQPALLLGGLLLLYGQLLLAAEQILSGEEIMTEAHTRHEIYPYVFEQQQFVMTDRKGMKTVRQARRYWRLEDDEVFHFLLVFDEPPEVRGVALLASLKPDGTTDGGVYLPAFGPELKTGGENKNATTVMGTDFNVSDLSPENMDSYTYQRQPDTIMQEIPYYTVDALPRTAKDRITSGYKRRRHYVRQSTFFIERTDYFDRHDRLVKRRTQHDLRQVKGNSWLANMTLMENLREDHITLIKIQKRVYSRDYVPSALFRPKTLFSGRHMEAPELWEVEGKANTSTPTDQKEE